MYAIIECGGKQYRVSEGDVIKVEKLDVEVGSNFEIDRVLLLGGEKTVVGTPLVEGTVVSCKVLNQDKAKKVLVFHYKAKKNIRKRYGHRQPFTSLLIEKILTGQAPKVAVTDKAASTEAVEKPKAKATTTKATTAKATAAKATTAKATTAKATTAKATTAKATTAKATTAKATTAKATTAKATTAKATTAKTTTAKAETAASSEAAAKPKTTRKTATKTATAAKSEKTEA